MTWWVVSLLTKDFEIEYFELLKVFLSSKRAQEIETAFRVLSAIQEWCSAADLTQTSSAKQQILTQGSQVHKQVFVDWLDKLDPLTVSKEVEVNLKPLS